MQEIQCFTPLHLMLYVARCSIICLHEEWKLEFLSYLVIKAIESISHISICFKLSASSSHMYSTLLRSLH